MNSQKKSSQKFCIKCHVLLNEYNWLPYLKPRSNYICTPCLREYGKKYYKLSADYKKKQSARYRIRKSVVLFSYGNQCVQCYEDDGSKLTIDIIKNSKLKIKNNIYEWLYNNPLFKNTYQILCYNCKCSKNISYKDKYALENKKKIIKNYGSQCIECGEYKIERLIIDYKNNDGAHQRHHFKCGTGAKFYRWLIKNNFPNDLGLQILCFNCSYLKRDQLKFSGI